MVKRVLAIPDDSSIENVDSDSEQSHIFKLNRNTEENDQFFIRKKSGNDLNSRKEYLKRYYAKMWSKRIDDPDV